jgi:hypothetical protein
MPFFGEGGKETIACCSVRKSKVAREVVNIMCWRINEETAFRKLFSRDKNLEFGNPEFISRKIKSK